MFPIYIELFLENLSNDSVLTISEPILILRHYHGKARINY